MAADKMVVRDLFGKAVDEPFVFKTTGQSDATIKGRYAEFMVCAYLTRLGHNVIHVDTTGFDLILEYDGHSYRLDVKSTSRARIGTLKQSVLWHTKKAHWRIGETEKRRRPINPDDCDMLALFHNVFETVVYYPVIKPQRQPERRHGRQIFLQRRCAVSLLTMRDCGPVMGWRPRHRPGIPAAAQWR